MIIEGDIIIVEKNKNNSLDPHRLNGRVCTSFYVIVAASMGVKLKEQLIR